MNPKYIDIKKFDNYSSFYNYRPTNILNNSIGVDEAKFPSEPEDLTEYPLNIASRKIDRVEGVAFVKQYYADSGNTQNKILLYGSDKKVYINQMFYQDFNLYWLYDLTFDSAPITLAYKKNDLDSVILASKEQMKIWQTGFSPYTIENVPIITSMCMNDGVLFCTIKEPAFKVWYATNLDVENVGSIDKNSGYITLEDDLGYARKIITLNEDVYVLRDYGISKINFYKTSVSVTQIYQSTTKIFCNTVASCGDSVLFLTGNGLHVFNGVKVTKINLEIADILTSNNENAVANSLADKYYLALRLNFDDDKQILCEQGDFVNNAILVVNANDYSYEIIRGVDVKSLVTLKTELCEKMLLTFNSQHSNKLGQIVDKSICFESPLPKYWASGSLVENFNPKIFTKLVVKADKDVKFNLVGENGLNMSFTTYKSGINKFYFKIYSNDIKITISSTNTEAQVESVSLEYYED